MRPQRPPRHEGSTSSNRERWLVSYADFVTLLLAFFVTMYAITRLDQEKMVVAQQSINAALNAPVFKGGFPAVPGAGPVPSGQRGDLAATPVVRAPTPSKMEETADTVKQELRESLEKGELRLLHTGKGLVLRLPEFLFFDSGQAKFRPEALPLLQKLAGLLGKIPNDVLIEGHTDNRPIHTPQFPSNWELSTARAAALVRFFVEEQRLAPARFAAAGYGEHQPLADNNEETGRQANRRVDLIIRPLERTAKTN
jgi:chemotaxis protein MotB